MRDGKKARSTEESKKHVSDAIQQYKETINEPVQQINENTFKYKGSKISMYGEASDSNNMAVEGWLILEGGNYEEELSEIYAEGYNSYKEAIKAVYDDLEKRAYPHKIQIEEISFI